MRELRERLHRRLVDELPGVRLNGCPVRRHPGNLNLSIEGVPRESLLGAFPDVAFSGGSACSSGSAGPSHVIAALGHNQDADTVVRFGLGRSTTLDDVDEVARRFVAAVRRLRSAAAGGARAMATHSHTRRPGLEPPAGGERRSEAPIAWDSPTTSGRRGSTG